MFWLENIFDIMHCEVDDITRLGLSIQEAEFAFIAYLCSSHFILYPFSLPTL